MFNEEIQDESLIDIEALGTVLSAFHATIAIATALHKNKSGK